MSPEGAESARPDEVVESDCLESDESTFGRKRRRGGEAIRAAIRWFFARGARNIALQYHRLDREDVSESDSKFG